MNVLVLNAGSSSLKYKLIALDASSPAKYDMPAEGNEPADAGVVGEAAAKAVRDCVGKGLRVDAVAHRLVHGGPKYRQPVLITDDVLAVLRGLRELDPLHNPQELVIVEASQRELPGVAQVAVFDTGFHATLPEVAWRYALPKQWADELHLRRYGFHGISYQYIAGRVAELGGSGGMPQRVIVCHLGSGASVCALLDGVSVDTSMGMTPLEGLVMATRCGDIDPGLILYLLRENKVSVGDLDDLLNHKSGLAGLAEGSGGDTRRLESAGSGHDAEIALQSFAYSVRKYIGAYAAALGGLDALIFTGGIGEGSADIRQRVCGGLEFLGIRLDDAVNSAASAQSETKISAEGNSVAVWVVPTNEELEIARQTVRLLSHQ